MSQYVIDKRDFFKGLSQSEEVGGFFRDMQGINLHSPLNVGVLMNNSKEIGVYSEGSATALTSPITQLVSLVNYTGTGANFRNFIVALSDNHAVQIRVDADNGETITDIITFAGINSENKTGAAVYKLGSQSTRNIGLFYSLANDIGVWDATTAFTNAGKWDGDFMSDTTNGPANASAIDAAPGGFRPMYWHKRHDILYWGSINGVDDFPQVDKFDANVGVRGTLTENALDLPKGWSIQDFGQLRDYLAILCVAPPRGGTDAESSQHTSKIFFWDGVKDSWNYETPEISDELVRLFNTDKGLFAIGKGDGISYYQVELEQVQRLNNWPKDEITIASGGRDGSDNANYGAIVAAGDELLFLGKDGANAHIFSLGDRFGLSSSKTLMKKFFLKSATGVGAIRLGDIVKATPTKYYASYWNDVDGSGTANAGDQYRIVRFSPANANTKEARIDTVELDSYFEGTGRLKKLNWIRFDIDELASGDILEIYKEIDYDGAWTRLDGSGSAGAENSIRESDFSGENRTAIKFTRQDQFRHLRLRFDWTGSSVKVRRVVVDFNYQE